MAIQNVDLGTHPTGEGGDSPRSGFDKVNKNFKEIDELKLNKTDLKDASTTVKGIVQLVDASNDTSKTKAPTANQVKILNDRLNSAGVYTKAPTLLNTQTDLLVDVPDVCQTFTLSGTYTNAPPVFGNGSITGMIDVKKRWFDVGVQKILTIRHLSGQIWENVKNGETWGGWKRIDAIDSISTAIRIPKDADLNTYLDEGFFFCPSNVDTQTIKNKPVRNHAFSLHVEKNAVSTQTLKYYITTNFPKVEVWVRSKFEAIVNGGVWGEWEKLAYTSDSITGNAATASVAELANSAVTQPTATNNKSVASTAFVQAVNTAETGASAYALKLKTPRKIGGVNFDGTVDINLPGVNTTGNQSTSGNSATATKLQTPRKINGIEFSGEKDIVIPTPTPDTANESRAGILRIATQTQANTGTDDTTAISPKKLKAAVANQMNAAGSAPMSTCRAWITFNGVTGSIISSLNVSSVLKNAVGDYTINFQQSMPNADYAVIMAGGEYADGTSIIPTLRMSSGKPLLKSNTAVRISARSAYDAKQRDIDYISLGVFC